MKRRKYSRNKDHSLYAFRDGQIRITTFIEIERTDLLTVLSGEADRSLLENIGCVTYLVDEHGGTLDMSMLADGALRVEATISAEIAEQTVRRHRLLFTARAVAGARREKETFEDECSYFASSVPYRPEEHIVELAHPPWEKCTDVEFAQVLSLGTFRFRVGRTWSVEAEGVLPGVRRNRHERQTTSRRRRTVGSP
jgi:hypothetical protein